MTCHILDFERMTVNRGRTLSTDTLPHPSDNARGNPTSPRRHRPICCRWKRRAGEQEESRYQKNVRVDFHFPAPDRRSVSGAAMAPRSPCSPPWYLGSSFSMEGCGQWPHPAGVPGADRGIFRSPRGALPRVARPTGAADWAGSRQRRGHHRGPLPPDISVGDTVIRGLTPRRGSEAGSPQLTGAE